MVAALGTDMPVIFKLNLIKCFATIGTLDPDPFGNTLFTQTGTRFYFRGQKFGEPIHLYISIVNSEVIRRPQGLILKIFGLPQDL